MPDKKQHITRTTKDVLAYIIQHKTLTGGASPSIREIGDACHLQSTSAVHYHLERLQDAGLIDRDPHLARNIRVAGETWSCPQAASA
ncbi:MAG TPA: MarR family transcriptional regulator [Anaerolineaceae bacterium]|jgi:repressor LexA|nr:MarR family transcriptional regulator [Longilinea sp.]HOD04867.1 MarR family transcriptional regulator [Anaerolineaceae bacterium]HQF63697.1 MarR family transcriptional regulator [Anaerolineaceae bacterium]